MSKRNAHRAGQVRIKPHKRPQPQFDAKFLMKELEKKDVKK